MIHSGCFLRLMLLIYPILIFLVVDYTYKWNVLPVGMKFITNSFIVSLIAAFTNFRAAMLAL